MDTAKEQFTGQASPALLASLREIARSQGHDFDATLEDAMRMYVERKTGSEVQPARSHTFDPAWSATVVSTSC